MSSLFNIIWFVFVGWWSAIIFMILSGLFAITIVGFPIAKALLQFAILNAFPFGKDVIRETELKGEANVSQLRKICGVIVNIIWFPIGIILTVFYIVIGILSFCTIIGIPAGIVYIRMAQLVLFPIGAKVVSKKQAQASATINEMNRRNR